MSLKIKKVEKTEKIRMPEAEGGIIKLFQRIGMNSLVGPDKTEVVKTGISIEIPKGHICLVGLASDVTEPSTGLALAEGIKFFGEGPTGEIILKVMNTSDTARVLRNEIPVAYCAVIAVVNFGTKEKDEA
jgi:dUTPase